MPIRNASSSKVWIRSESKLRRKRATSAGSANTLAWCSKLLGGSFSRYVLNTA
jgi:hypothetical protein